MKVKNHFLPVIAMGMMIFAACDGGEKSAVTAWKYNDERNGGFEVVDYVEQETGPGLVLIEGGTFTMGRTEQDIIMNWDNIPRRATVASFYMDETEVANVHWLEYLYWLNRVFSTDYPHGDSKFPHAVETFLDLPISDDDKRKILWDNCAEFYRLGT